MQAAAQADTYIAKRTEFFEHRVREELYDFAADPDALVNLIDQEGSAGVLAEMRGELHAWMIRTDDFLRDRFETEIVA